MKPLSAAFFEPYEWCLNPYLTLDEHLDRLHWELGRESLPESGWDADERAINAWLLTCGIACTVDDYLGERLVDLTGLIERFPLAGLVVRTLNALHDAAATWRDLGGRSWRRRWDACVDQACTLLTETPSERLTLWTELQRTVEALRRRRLPRQVACRRPRLPEGFRSQDLAHQDGLELARRFDERQPDRSRDVLVVGIRTAGAYLAPLIRAYLQPRWTGRVSWLSIRPKNGLSARERHVFSRAARTGALVVVTDDHPNSGRTHHLVLTKLDACRVPPDHITVLSPRHPVDPTYTLPSDAPGVEDVTFITIEPQETHKARILEEKAVEPWLREWLGELGWQSVRVRRSPDVDALNAELEERFGDSFQVRLKRVYGVEGTDSDGRSLRMHVIAKSVGWGWMGYHSYFAAIRLYGLVPLFVGLREGFLFSEWIGDLVTPPRAPSQVAVSDIARYVALRTSQLHIPGTMALGADSHVWNGWSELSSTCYQAYGPYSWRLKRPVLRDVFHRFEGPNPTLLDGRMTADEWVPTSRGLRKLDFEQHNFGAPESNLVDPAYDLAGAVFELGLRPEREEELIRYYAEATGDHGAADRMLLHKVLIGHVAMQNGASWAPRARDGQAEEWNRRYVAARDFLTYTAHRITARRRSVSTEPRWTDRLMFLDLDGVFDSDTMGFPHTTLRGLVALDLLQNLDFAVVPNTGRSVEHVQFYCRTYGFPGGVAEYGSVMVDAVAAQEVPLITSEGKDALRRCRELLRQEAGVFVDPTYHYAVRAYRYREGRTTGLDPSETEAFLEKWGLRELEYIATTADTYFLERGVNKGTGASAVRSLAGVANTAALAIGDSDQDIPMFAVVDAWYAPANCSPGVRAEARSGRGRIMSGAQQKGLLQAVEEIIRDRQLRPVKIPSLRLDGDIRSAEDLLVTLFQAAERSPAERLMAALHPLSL